MSALFPCSTIRTPLTLFCDCVVAELGSSYSIRKYFSAIDRYGGYLRQIDSI